MTSEQHRHERIFAAQVLQCCHGYEIRGVVETCGVPEKRCRCYLGKWSTKGWYDYGVNLDLGWLTDLGREKLQAMVRAARFLHYTM